MRGVEGGNLAAAIDELTVEDLHAVGAAALGDSIVELTGLIRRLQAERLRRLAVFDGQDGAAADGARGTAGWLRWRCLPVPGRGLRRSRWLGRWTGCCRVTRAALAAGQISFDHARVLAYGSVDVPAELVAAAEPMLVEHAGRLEPHRLRLVVEHWRAHVVPAASDRDAEQAFSGVG